MVLRLIGLKQLPAVSTSTIARLLSSLDESSVQNLEALRSELVLDRLTALDSPRITLDFDRPALRGSVIGMKRKAEGTAVGFKKSKKGQRSYYALYCRRTRRALIEVPMDSAFYSDEILANRLTCATPSASRSSAFSH